VAVRENGYTGLRCPGCGLIYLSPRPSPEDILNIYGHDTAHVSGQLQIEGETLKRLAARHSLRLLQTHIQSGSLLEIGAGAGFFLDEARRKGFEPFAIEFSPSQAEFIRHQLALPCEQAALADGAFNGRQFDVIYHCDVIGHFYDPHAEFRAMHRRLVDDGILMFETGNLADVLPEHFHVYDRFQYPDHLFFFGVETLQKLLQETGFEVLSISRYSVVPYWRLIRSLAPLVKSVKRRGTVAPAASSGDAGSEGAAGNGSLRGGLKLLWHYLQYCVRYPVGAVAPKRGRPQTVIVVAKKQKAHCSSL